MRGHSVRVKLGLCAWLGVVCPALMSCDSMYYKTWEQFGYEKRDLFVASVEDASESQAEAKEQFQSALDEFLAVTGAEGGELEAAYRGLNAELSDSEAAAQRVSDRVDDVADVAGALFTEWESELEQYTNADLRRASERTLRETRQSYEQMIAAMRRTESKMEPILVKFRDNVLFLKHNLNAQAVAALSGISEDLKVEVAALISDMEASIAEAEQFINKIEK